MNAIILSAVWGIIMMYSGIFIKYKSGITKLAILGVLLLIISNWMELSGVTFISVNLHDMLSFTTFGYVFNIVAFFSTLIYFLLSGDDIVEVGKYPAEYYALIFFVLCGVSIVSSFANLLMLFIGIEIVSIPLYILAGSDKKNLKSNEASLKYFLMGSFSTGIMLMGIALLYGGAGSFLLSAVGFGVGVLSPTIALGLVLLLVSLGFKASAAPFHFWTPDVYDGSPTVFTSFMATVVKSAVFIAFVRLFDQAFGKMHDQWQLLVAIITAATMLIGNITAVFQQSVKRMLAYSSIAQAGFMMLAIFSLNTIAKQGLILYAAGYSIASIGIFAVIAKMKDYSFEGFNGLASKQPWVALSVTICLFSLAGIPLTVGFFSKYYMILGAMKTGSMFWLVILGILSAAVSVYYYFRVIQAMYFKESTIDQELQLGKGFKYMLLVNASLVIILGFRPGLLLQLLNF